MPKLLQVGLLQISDTTSASVSNTIYFTLQNPKTDTLVYISSFKRTRFMDYILISLVTITLITNTVGFVYCIAERRRL